MGTNKRYELHYDQLRDHQILESIMRNGGTPETLTDIELELDEQPITRPPIARAVQGWVRYQGVPIKVDAEAVAWTPYTVALRWRGPNEQIHKAWVWAAAIRNL